VSFLKNHLLGIGSAVVLGLLALLIILSHTDDLNHRLKVPPLSTYGPEVPAIVTAYHSRTNALGLTEPLLDALVSKHSPIKRVAFTVLLAFTSPEKQLAAYLHHTRFTQNAKRLFNVSHRTLNPGEILLLCDLALGHPVPQHDPDAALARRNHLLTELQKKGALTDRQYHTERNRALSLSADHRPIY